jgi:hypothetical protein
VLAAAGCIEKTELPVRGDDDTIDLCPEPFADEMTETFPEVYNPDGIWRTHKPPQGGAMCFDCHLCAKDGVTPVDNTHFVCNHCHDETGAVMDDGSGCECGDLDCSVDPPMLGCADCHTDGCNGHASARQMNQLCDFCHIPAQEES